MSDSRDPETTGAQMPEPPPDEEQVAAEYLDPVTPELVDEVVDALDRQDKGALDDLIAPLHVADIGDLIEDLSAGDIPRFIDLLGDELDAEVLAELDDPIRDYVLEILGVDQVAAALQDLESDDAVQLIEDLDDEQRAEILAALPHTERAVLEEGLSYPEDSAGRLMNREIVTISESVTVGQTIDYLRASEELPEDFYNIFMTDAEGIPVGYAPLSRVLRSRRPTRVADIMETELRTVPLTMDQEEVAHLFRRYGLVEAAVVHDTGRLAGVITVDDIVDVIDEEAEEDLMRLAGVAETGLNTSVADTAKARFPWLVVNLFTAVLASAVIALFESTISAVVALAVLMPIIASMGGNAGTQTLTVVVRALAMKDIGRRDGLKLITKEVIVGLANGLIFALLTGIVGWIYAEDAGIGLVIATAMVINMFVAGLAGAGIPMALQRFGVDPAIASTVFLTTVTDVVGFFAFLGLAGLYLL